MNEIKWNTVWADLSSEVKLAMFPDGSRRTYASTEFGTEFGGRTGEGHVVEVG